MNYWTEKSIAFAEQRNYLDELFRVYPLSPNHMGFDAIIEKCTAPKETNRQMGPMFKNWIARGVIGVPILNDPEKFLRTNGNCLLNSTDSVMQDFARKFLGFTRNKGVDFLAKFSGKYIVGEAKFLTDFGGHQNAQFDDALSTLHSFTASEFEVIPVAIIDGVIYIRNHSKMHDYLQHHPEYNIMSALVLREFLYSL
ncbi:MAG: hypothetical protein IJP89_04855 [Synergistaceae bacterium]|nr:hypothetical protein [Synergistaceae bacterium]